MNLEPLIKELKCDDCDAVYANVIRTWDLKERIEWLLSKKLGDKLKAFNFDGKEMLVFYKEDFDKAFEDVIKK